MNQAASISIGILSRDFNFNIEVYRIKIKGVPRVNLAG